MNEDQLQLTRLEHLLQENLEVAKETNVMLRDMRRLGRVWFWLRLLIWAMVIILPLLLLKPIIETLIPAAGNGSSFFGFPTQEDLERAIDSYQGE
jgi:hypothetical protein